MPSPTHAAHVQPGLADSWWTWPWERGSHDVKAAAHPRVAPAGQQGTAWSRGVVKGCYAPDTAMSVGWGRLECASVLFPHVDRMKPCPTRRIRHPLVNEFLGTSDANWSTETCQKSVTWGFILGQGVAVSLASVSRSLFLVASVRVLEKMIIPTLIFCSLLPEENALSW